MAVTPDNSTLIVWESFGGTLTAFDIGPDGDLSNRRVWAALPGDGIVLDAQGAVWTPGWTEEGPACLRVAEGGEVLDTIRLDRAGVACTLGGEDGRTLFMLSADWRMQDGFEDNVQRLLTGPETGQVLTAPPPPSPRRPPVTDRLHAVPACLRKTSSWRPTPAAATLCGGQDRGSIITILRKRAQ